MAGPTTAERGERQQESSDPPLARRRLRGNRLRTIIILAVVLVLLPGGSVWLLYGSQWLRVTRVSISGTRVLTPAQVREAADVPVGSPLVSVDTGAIEARLRRALPRIDEVDVVRAWPRGIGLRVVERTAVLVVQKDRDFIEVDKEGVRFATVSQAPKGVPALQVAVSRTGTGAAGLRRFGEARLVREAVRVAGALPAAVARGTQVVKVRSYDDISLVLTGGTTVSWGSGEKGAAKARALTALMKASPRARHFDVSVPTAPASAGS
ncbi:cell division protein ftsQ-like protein [Streptomyces zinciresistens K42]|uniref:Cell division protein FtsQ n=1 Tax=Streptomyces zinciresistens K42 TaxID=700597 RepID=G2G9B4_9ACTN|nr:FtsQ-type POTRA domain-containing protein [Streptomyces zinciresistens]EGX59948.1 cell division protein ftsQ-like protein [Streptomyces zinciresistens K42]